MFFSTLIEGAHRFRRMTPIVLTMLLVPVDSLIAQGHKDVIRGRVATDSGAAISDAAIIVTMAPTAEVFRGVSDSSGNYSLSIANGSGEYLLYVGALGRRPFRQRLTRTGGDTTFIVNVKLPPVVATLAAVRVQAQRPRPTRSFGTDPTGAGTDGMDKTVDGIVGALPPDLQGNLDAMAALIPGLTVTPTGASAFGLAPSNNKATLNGLSFAGTDLPRDARTATRFTTSPWDPTRGGFNGVLTSTRLTRGGNISARTGHLALDHPALQFSDPLAARLGREFMNLAASQGGTGAFSLDKYFYNYGAQISRRTSRVASLLDLDPEALHLSGVSRDSAAVLLQVLRSLSVPLRSAGIPSQRITTTGSFIERIDHVSPASPNGGVPGPAWWVTGYGNYSQSAAATLTPSAPPTSTGRSSQALVAVQGLYSTYIGSKGQYVNETTAGLMFSDDRGRPYLQLPSGSVLISSQLPDGSVGLGALRFGGNGMLASRMQSWSWEVINETSFLAGGRSSLPLKLYLQSKLDGFNQSPAANRSGAFNFPSLSALASNAPTSFSRTLTEPKVSAGEWSGAAALGGNWVNGNVTWTGGARVDGNVYTARPSANPTVASAFGARTDHVPNTVAVSPRVGFTWNYKGQRGLSSTGTSISTINQGGSQLRGGIGKFRGLLAPTLIADAITSTALPGGTQRLLCIGPAVPPPDWQSYANDLSTIPDRCIGTSTFADAAPGVKLFDQRYTSPESWRASLGWTSTVRGVYLAIDGTYSLNLHQSGITDLNFTGAPRFSLVSENDRPVFVGPVSIAPSTGAVSSVDARSSSAFGPVLERISDLRGDARQLTVYAIPNIPLRWGVVTIGYTYLDARGQTRGFDQNTGGDPRTVGWARASYAPRHQVLMQGGHVFGRFGLTMFARATSGLPFTPTVVGDVNGDGSYNDRAFIFDPVRTSDTAVVSGLRTLLASAPSGPRDCLRRQIGQIVAQNSCIGPWSATMNASAYFFPSLPASGGRAKISLSLNNLLGGLDGLLHGSQQLRGWGTTPFPDPTLYRVRGFDPAAQRFLYAVNPRFGSSSPGTTTLRNPFRITIDISFDLGRSAPEQELEQNLRVRPSLVATRASADSIKKRYMTRNFTDLYGVLIRMSDSLALSHDQLEQMDRQRTLLLARADTIYGALSTYLAALPDNYDRKEALKRTSGAADAGWVAIYAEKAFLVKLLTPGQIRLLPASVLSMITVPGYKGRFFFGPGF